MNKKNKISFDFDSTLSRQDVQDFCFSLIRKGYDIYITTSRYERPDLQWNRPDMNNDDLFKISDKLKIDRNNIRFTNFEDKFNYLGDFHFHFDDCWRELNMINKNTHCTGLSVISSNYKQKFKRINDKKRDVFNIIKK